MVRTRSPIGGRVVTPPPPPVVPAAPVLPPGAVVPPGWVVPPAPVFPAVRGAPPRPEPPFDVALIPPEAPVSPPGPAPPGAPAPPASTPPLAGGTGADVCVLPPAAVSPPSLVAPPLTVVSPAPDPGAWVPPGLPDDVLFPLQPSANGVPSSRTRAKGRALWIILMTSPANEDVPARRTILALRGGSGKSRRAARDSIPVALKRLLEFAPDTDARMT
jgi:hypothetical protein